MNRCDLCGHRVLGWPSAALCRACDAITCDRPPRGWYCLQPWGHVGSCPAWPVPPLAARLLRWLAL